MESSCDNTKNSNTANSNLNKKDNQVTLYPVVVAPEVTSGQDSETDSESSDCEQWVGDAVNTSVVPQTSTINVKNSSDIVIKPLTQFHGPVTIYQNINSGNRPPQENLNIEYKAEVVINDLAKPTPESASSEKLHPNEKHLLTPYKRYAIYGSIFILALLAIITTIAVSLSASSNEGDEEDKNDGIPSVPDRGNSSLTHHIMFSKAEWGGRPPLNFTKPLNHPTEYVVISHTAGILCEDYEDCAPILQNIQSAHVAKLKSPDIGYNFIIGGDANIYEGRGWDIRNFHGDNNIGICFMGNFVYDSLTTGMISALKDLLALGIRLNKLPADYKLVCDNQTYATLSPGENVFKEIKKFPNFVPGRVEIPPWKP